MVDIEFRLLGPVGIWRDGRRVGPPTAQQRTVLAMLLLDPGRSVPVDRMVDAVWGSNPPASARNAVQGHVSRLRRLVAPLTLRHTSHGYCLDADRRQVDLHRYRDAVREAREAGPASAGRLFEAALAEWRGPALSDVAGTWLSEGVGKSLEQERLSTVEDHAALELRAGRHDAVMARLSPLVAEHPLRERLVCLLLTALDHGGRRTDALALFRAVRQQFNEELGIEPGAELQRAHRDILQGDRPSRTAWDTAATIPRQLPSDIPHFTGRETEEAMLEALLQVDGDPPSRAVPVQLITGTGGVGKTALAVHWAHRFKDHFPDGQLYGDLRGFGPGGTPSSPSDVARVFLEALGVPENRIPTSPESRIGLYRSLLASRTMLILLDNARDAEQVRPLLPGAPGCLVLVTSRDALTGLVAVEGARSLRLGLFTTDEARELIAHRMGADRVAAEPEAVDNLIAVCGGLPLTLGIVTARAVTQPTSSLATLLPEGPHGGGLEAFEGSDARADLRTVFSWSHRALSESGALLFRLLGLHEGTTFTTAAAASLAAAPLPGVRRTLAELTQAHLTSEHAPGRYSRHDLLWAYARELVHSQETDTARQDALHRLLDHYLHTALLGDRQLNRHHQIPLAVDAPRTGVVVTELTDRQQALAWFRLEHETLVAAVRLAARAGFHQHTWQLARAVRTFLYQQGLFQDQEAIHRVALGFAERASEAEAEAYCHFGMGQAHVRLHHYREGRSHLRTALERYSDLADHIGQAVAHTQLAVLEGMQGHSAAALDHNERALALCQAVGHRAGEAMALNNIGWYRAELGDHRQALRHCTEALVLLQDLGDGLGEAATLDSLGYIHHSIGRHEQAITYYEKALAIRRGRERVYQAETLPQLAEAQIAAGRVSQARATLSQALEQFEQFAQRDADAVRRRLREVDELMALSEG
ncbi:SARP family transcriptional regulator [Streptomyces malachitofuscus]|nr:SARP family transcriptional regulator [Streptomyces malachitofuscus]